MKWHLLSMYMYITFQVKITDSNESNFYNSSHYCYAYDYSFTSESFVISGNFNSEEADESLWQLVNVVRPPKL